MNIKKNHNFFVSLTISLQYGMRNYIPFKSSSLLADEVGDGGLISLFRFCQMFKISSADTCSSGLLLMRSNFSSSEGAFPSAALGLFFFLAASLALVIFQLKAAFKLKKLLLFGAG